LNLLFTYFLCGILTGFLSGLLGIGGGIIGIPILLTFFSQQGVPEQFATHMAIATLLATIIPTTMIASYRHWKNRLIDIHLVKKLLPGLLMGAIAGTIISSSLNPGLLRNIFVFFLFMIAFQMLFVKEIKPVPILFEKIAMGVITFLIGAFCSMLGLGGGILMVPYLRLAGMSTKHAIGTSTACILPNAIVGTISYALNGMNLTEVHAYNSGFIYWPAFFGISAASILFAPLGAYFTPKIPSKYLNMIFVFFILFSAVKLLVL
jgi:uncharacterized membrane protein YfcA